MSEQQRKKQTLIDKMMKGIPTPPSGPAPAQQPEDVMSTFDGNLSEKPISYLLRAAEHYEITGKLFIGSVHCNVCIQFGLGRAVHATSPLSHGTEAIMDLFIWRDGVIRFEPGGQPETVTVQESISDILIRGEAFIENHNFLENNYINEMSFLLRPPERLAEGELENRLRAARVRDPHLHAEFYSNVYGTRNIKDTAEKMNLSHSQWVNIAADLLKLGLLLTPDNRCIKAEDPLPPMMQPPLPVVNQPPQIILPELGPGTISLNIPQTNNLPRAEVPDIFKPTPTREVAFPVPTLDEWHLQSPKPQRVDHNAQKLSDAVKVGVPEQMLALDPMMRNAVWLLLNKSETGILSFEALQFFLEREFSRAYRFKTTLSLALFCVTVNPDPLGNMPAEVCALLTAAVTNIKREVDMFGHFGDRAFGLLLPGVESHQACVLADRINRDLVKLKPDLAQYEPCLHFGIASAPQDATDMEGLAKAAQVAMFIAALHNELKVEANEVSNRQTQQQLSQGQPSLPHSAGDPGETMQLKRPTAEQLGMPFLPSQTPAAPAQPAPPQGFAGFPSQPAPQSAPPFVQPAQQPPPSLQQPVAFPLPGQQQSPASPQPFQQAPQFPAQPPHTQQYQPAPQFPTQQTPPQPFQQQQPAAPPLPFPQQPAQTPQPPHQQPLQQQPQLPPQQPQLPPQQPQLPPQQPQLPPQPQPPAQPFPHQPPPMPPQTNPFLPQQPPQPPQPPQQPPEQKPPDSSQQQQQGPNYQW